MAPMGRIVALPARGEVFADARGGDRMLRVSWHHEHGVVVLSLWRGAACAGTFRVSAEEVPGLVAALTEGLAQGYVAGAAGLPGEPAADAPG